MNIGLIIKSNECGKWESYYVKDDKAYSLSTDKLYNGPTPQDGIDYHIFRNIWNRVFVGDGYFLNPAQGLIDVDFDVIFLVNESDEMPNDFVNSIRNKYKNAVIVGTTKEAIPGVKYGLDALTNFFKLCDKAVVQFNQETCDEFSERLGKKVYSLPIPYKVEAIREKFKRSTTPSKTILAGTASWDTNRGYNKCLDFCNYLANKYGYTVVHNNDDKTWAEWLQGIDEVDFVINMDTQQRLGQVTIESLAVGTPHIGGISDTALCIMPEWATNDTDKLEEIFVSILENGYDDEKYYKRLVDRYSFKNNKKLLHEILEDKE